MDKRAIECYAMIGSKEPIIKWLKDEGVKTKQLELGLVILNIKNN